MVVTIVYTLILGCVILGLSIWGYYNPDNYYCDYYYRDHKYCKYIEGSECGISNPQNVTAGSYLYRVLLWCGCRIAQNFRETKLLLIRFSQHT